MNATRRVAKRLGLTSDRMFTIEIKDVEDNAVSPIQASMSLTPKDLRRSPQILDIELPSFFTGPLENEEDAIVRINELIDKLSLNPMYGTVDSFLGWDESSVDDGNEDHDDHTDLTEGLAPSVSDLIVQVDLLVNQLEDMMQRLEPDESLTDMYHRWCMEEGIAPLKSVRAALEEAEMLLPR